MQVFRYMSYQKKPIGPREKKVPDPALDPTGGKKDDLAKSGSTGNLKDSDKKVASKDSAANVKGAKK